MTDLARQAIAIEIESIRLKKLLIEMYSGSDLAVPQIIVKDSRAAIRQSQHAIQVLSKL